MTGFKWYFSNTDFSDNYLNAHNSKAFTNGSDLGLYIKHSYYIKHVDYSKSFYSSSYFLRNNCWLGKDRLGDSLY